jgi:HSP20 family protein
MKIASPTAATTNPWSVMRELATMQEQMNRIWEGVYDRGHEDVTSRGAWAPAVDVYETDQREVVVKADVPGLKRDEIDLTFENHTLTLRGERRRDEGVRDEAYHRVERVYGPFSRSFTLPATVDAARVRADYRDGVLTVTLPLREETRPRQIQVDATE